MFLSAMFANRCIVVFLASFFSLLLFLIDRLVVGRLLVVESLLVVFDQGHHFPHCVGGAFD
jgi:hypothetical protein